MIRTHTEWVALVTRIEICGPGWSSVPEQSSSESANPDFDGHSFLGLIDTLPNISDVVLNSPSPFSQPWKWSRLEISTRSLPQNFTVEVPTIDTRNLIRGLGPCGILHLRNLQTLNIASFITESGVPVELPPSVKTVNIFDICGHVPWAWMRKLLRLTHVDLQKLGLYFSKNDVGTKCQHIDHPCFVDELALFQRRSLMAYETFCMPADHCTRNAELVPKSYPIRIPDKKDSNALLRRIWQTAPRGAWTIPRVT